MKKSTHVLFKKHGYRIDRFIHNYIYFNYYYPYVKAADIIANTLLRFTWLKPLKHLFNAMFERFHSKVLSFEDTKKILTLDEDIRAISDKNKKIVPYKYAYDIIFNEPEHIAVMDCPCKKALPPYESANCCIAVGRDLSNFWIEHGKKYNVRKISQDDALSIVKEYRKTGHITQAFFKVATGGGTGVICNCNPDSCISFKTTKVAKKFDPHLSMNASSGYLVNLNTEDCDNCGTCATHCHFGALSIENDVLKYNSSKCIGCGLCIELCPKGNLSLYIGSEDNVPLDIDIVKKEYSHKTDDEKTKLNIIKIIKSVKQGMLPPPLEIPEKIIKGTATAIHFRGKISKLTSIERTLCAMYHKEPDHVPVTPLVYSAARQITGMNFPDLSMDGEKAADIFYSGFDLIGGDLVVLMLDLSVEAADFGQKMIFPENSTAHPDYSKPAITCPDDYLTLKPINISEAVRMQEYLKLCRLMVKRVGLKGLVGGFVFGPAGILGMLRGAENFLQDCILHPKKVRKACETITAVLIEYVNAQAQTGVPAIAIDTLYASESGLPRKIWEEIEAPFCREICDAIRKNKLMVGVHNCGHGPYADLQIKWMEPEVFSLAHLPDDCRTAYDLKERHGDATTIIGYISTQLLASGTPQQVIDECRRQIDILAKDGGYILAPGCEYPPNSPLANAYAMVEAAKRFG